MNIYGVCGYPLSHSLSPKIFNYIFKKLKMDAVYIPVEINPEKFFEVFKNLKYMGIKAVNITLPFKEKVLKFKAVKSEIVKDTGSSNLATFENGMRLHNTDYYGIEKTFKEIGEPLNADVFVYGAGGAARTLIYYLLKKNARVYITNRTFSKIKRLIEFFGNRIIPVKYSLPEIKRFSKTCDFIVNSTSAEIKGGKIIADESFFSKNQIFFDMIYGRLTEFLKIAKSIGAVYINGDTMFIEQARKTFEIITGRKLDESTVKEAYNS